MSLVGVRRSLHIGHAIMVVLLVLSGLLLGYPDWRARMIGGYGREILDVHMWVGWAFLALPVLALAIAARGLTRDLTRRLGPPDPPWAWPKLNIVTSLLFSTLLVVTGVLLWVEADLPLWLLDTSLDVHIVLTWVLVVSVPLHTFMARKRIVTRTREILGIGPQPELDFPVDDEDPMRLRDGD
jgi:cytochrome b subunit of formate dehydrogenase